jgi:transcriptional regulator with XRE-family HTH domain
MSYLLYYISVMSPATLLREVRLSQGLTQGQLADRLGTTQAAVARLERPGANPTFKTLQRALLAAGHTLDLEATPRPSSVDETLIASNLRLTPAERLWRFESWHNGMQNLRAAAARSRARPA